MKNFTITFSAEQVNTVLNHLANGRWSDVDGLINSIQSQCAEQLRAAKKSEQQPEETATVSE